MKHCLTLNDFSGDEIRSMLASAAELKAALKAGEVVQPCANKTMAMVFEKDSLRTRMSFEVGMYQLGGHALHIGAQEIKMRDREVIEDISRVMSRFVDIVMIRTFEHGEIEEFAKYSTVPIINGLTDGFHPCQAMADMLTVQENFSSLEDVTICYVGDGNNVANSLALICSKLGVPFRVAAPKGYELDMGLLRRYGVDESLITCSDDLASLVKGANVLYTDVWTSMGQEAEKEARLKAFAGFQINESLLAQAAPDVKVLHCLPAHRGEEISAAVMDMPQCVVFDQAENRLHAQKAIIKYLLSC